MNKPNLIPYNVLNFKGAKLIDVSHHVSHQGPYPTGKMKKHYHSFHELVIILKGSVCVEISGKEVRAKTGDILFYHAGAAHKEQSTRGTEVICIEWEEKRKIEFPVLIHNTSRKICFLAKWLNEQDQSNYPYRRLLQDKIFEVIRIELTKDFESEENHPFIAKLKSFMIDNLNKPLALKNLANYAHTSKYHFLKKYKKITGRTPMEDLRNIRLETAKDMIVTTCMPLKAIASKVGFSNVYLFTKLFRKYYNTPPGNFRKNTDWVKQTVFSKL
ncbi:MAG: helix-turn-helix domain-containing protein [Elusimicrobia bacterium]|nr:helix-turn-helix domain-containing protein [Elusimicrobiota bacterium]